MVLDSWCDTLCTDLLGGGPELLCAFQWYVTEALVCNLPAESQSGTQIISNVFPLNLSVSIK